MRLERQLALPRLDARELEEVVDQMPQPLGVAQDHVEELAPSLGRDLAPRSSVSAKPRIAVSGVRSSWETFATKSRRTVSSRRSSVTSWKTATRAEPLPARRKAHRMHHERARSPTRCISRTTGSGVRAASVRAVVDRHAPDHLEEPHALRLGPRRRTARAGAGSQAITRPPAIEHEHPLDHAREHGPEPLLLGGRLG